MHSLPRLSSLQEFEQYCEQIAVGGLLPRPCEKYEQLYKDIEVVPRFPNLIGPKKEFYSKSALEYGIQHFSSMPFVHDCLSLQQYCKKSTSDSDLVSRVVEYNRPLIPPGKSSSRATSISRPIQIKPGETMDPALLMDASMQNGTRAKFPPFSKCAVRCDAPSLVLFIGILTCKMLNIPLCGMLFD